MKFYIQRNTDGYVTDAITYPYGDYEPIEYGTLPVGAIGGWFRFEDGEFVPDEDKRRALYSDLEEYE